MRRITQVTTDDTHYWYQVSRHDAAPQFPIPDAGKPFEMNGVRKQQLAIKQIGQCSATGPAVLATLLCHKRWKNTHTPLQTGRSHISLQQLKGCQNLVLDY